MFGIISSFLINGKLRVVLGGKSSQEYQANAGISQDSILGPTITYYTYWSDDVVCNIAIYADDTTLYYRWDHAF